MKSGAAGKSKSTADAIWSFRISPESGGGGSDGFFIQVEVTMLHK
jgi:hypothetical protein